MEKGKESSVPTWASDSLGDEPPHEVGAVFTPVRASERVDLWAKTKKSVKRSQSPGGRWPWTWNQQTPRNKGLSGSEHPSLGVVFPVGMSCEQTWKKQRCALIFENPPLSLHAPHQSQKGMWRNSKRTGPCHQLRNETLPTPNKALYGKTQESLSWLL